MVITDEAAFIILALIIVAGLIVLAVVGFGAVLMSRGYRVVGFGIVAIVIGGLMGPALYDRARNIPIRADLEARVLIPNTLYLTGQRVLFIETGSTICGELCRDVLGIGTDLEAYWVGAGGYTPDTFTDNPIGDVLDGAEHVPHVHLGAPQDGLGGQRYAETLSTGHAPPYDIVIVADDSGLIGFIAPELLGGPLPADVRVQHAVLVFTDWPDPFAGPPPAPAFRSVIGRYSQRPFLPLPFATRSESHPDYLGINAAWAGAICAGAGDAEARDAFTYAHLCAPETLNELFN